MANVLMQDGTTYNVSTLLSNGDSNTKLHKSNDKSTAYLTVGLSLSPARESGYEMCASRSPGCTQACLYTAGRGVYDNVKTARIAKTRLYHQDRRTFKNMLFVELAKWASKAYKEGKKLACRLNVFSDVQWEKVFPDMFKVFHDVQFYDYTKHFGRAFKYSENIELGNNTFPANYYLTFSRSETNDSQVDSIIKGKAKINIAVVFNSKELPKYWSGRKVVNGDETDLRFLDESGTIVGLYAKGRGKKDTSGFVVDTNGRYNLETVS